MLHDLNFQSDNCVNIIIIFFFKVDSLRTLILLFGDFAKYPDVVD